MFAFPLKFNTGVKVTFPKASTIYVPTLTIVRGFSLSPVIVGLLGFINIIVDGSIVPSSVSLAPIVATVIWLSSSVLFPKLSIATGASFTESTVISSVLVTSTVPSVNV